MVSPETAYTPTLPMFRARLSLLALLAAMRSMAPTRTRRDGRCKHPVHPLSFDVTMNTLLALAALTTAQSAPAWLPGDWEPYSNAFVGLRMLSIGKDTLSWKGCSNARFEVVDADANQVTVRLAQGST